ncbi:hypothetical protein [Sulfurovum sp.]|uniref:hypothetical protein n=1 Tax=Sulfurovum sp. TaxID=1969726 RepID=UPI002867BF3A|nr:hypothetical protein [Sulfurovum sp.]
MKILLVNANPVVSRVLALCTRDEHMVLDEVKSVEAVQKVGYDILFVDEASYTDNLSVLLEGLDIRKKVFLSFSEDFMRGFDETVKKPFLPSQIIKIIAQPSIFEVLDDVLEEGIVESSTPENTISIFPLCAEESIKEEISPTAAPLPIEDVVLEVGLKNQEVLGTKVLNMDDIVRIKELLDMGDDGIEINEAEFLGDDAYEARKTKVIKEQLIAEGLEILEEDEMVEALSASVEKASEKLDKQLKKIKKRHKKKIALGENERFNMEEALSAVIANLKPKKIKKLLNGEEIKIKIKLEDHT